jgi:hypothetical protein
MVAGLLKTRLSEVLFKVRLLNFVVPPPENVWSPAAVKDTVPDPSLIVPSFVKSPFKVTVPEPKLILAPEPTFKDAIVVVPNVTAFVAWIQLLSVVKTCSLSVDVLGAVDCLAHILFVASHLYQLLPVALSALVNPPHK